MANALNAKEEETDEHLESARNPQYVPEKSPLIDGRDDARALWCIVQTDQKIDDIQHVRSIVDEKLKKL